MSLVQSIFGGVGEKSGLSALFDKKTTEPPEAPASSNKRKRENSDDDNSDSDSTSSSGSSSSASETGKNNSKKEDPAMGATTRNEKDESKDADAEERTVFVGNLPLSTTRRSLAKLFKDCGKVQSTRLRSVAVAGVKLPQNRAGDQNLVKKVCTHTQQFDVQAKPTLQGYVVFVSQDSVPKALELNNTPISDTSPDATRATRRIRVDRASPTFDSSRSVFVGNLPYGAEEASLQDCFVQGCSLNIQDVESVRVIRDPATFQCKGFGYVQFRDRNMVATALQKMHEQVYMKRPLRVTVCGKSIKGRRGANKKQQTDSSGRPATMQGALRRVDKKQKKRRARGEKKKPGDLSKTKPGVSKRAAMESKVNLRVKKLQKRASKGMGKARSK